METTIRHVMKVWGNATPGIEPVLGRRWLWPIMRDDTMDDGIKTVGDIPKVWRDLFALIRGQLPSAVMAGGCLRDRDIGVKVNDIDIFVPEVTGKWEDLTEVEQILHELGASSVEILSDKVYPQGVDNHIVGVVEAKFVSCPLVFQFVIGNWGTSIEDLFACFDYGICKIAYDGRTIHRHQTYREDRRQKRFRITSRRSRMAFEKSIERYAKFKKKFPDWKFDLGHLHIEYGGTIVGEFDYKQRPFL